VGTEMRIAFLLSCCPMGSSSQFELWLRIHLTVFLRRSGGQTFISSIRDEFCGIGGKLVALIRNVELLSLTDAIKTNFLEAPTIGRLAGTTKSWRQRAEPVS
ncbi:MAG: hypothetical protein L0H05_07585, partial [Brevibacterium aurantiacum]|nr:hypothetical protein [Brevibacterium aurantiacum]